MEKGNNYILGIIGALVGGLIASLPWIIFYVYLDMLWSFLAIPIAIGALKGYQLFGGKEDKKITIIISVISILVISIVTFIVIPLLLLQRENLGANIDNLRYLYLMPSFKSAILKDYIFSLFFTVLGISGVISNIKRQLDENVSKIQITNLNETNKEQINKVRELFVKNNALTKQDAIDKQIILDEVDKKIFNTLHMQNIIRKYKGKYYFSEKALNNIWYRFGILYIKILLIVIIVSILLALI